MIKYNHEVKYYECDRMGITHHSNYIRFMEEARVFWMDEVGYGFDRMEAEGVVSPVTEVTCKYRKTTTFKDLIEVELSVKDASALKLSFNYTMRCKGAVVATGTSTHCFLDASTNKPIVLAERFPSLWAAIEEDLK